MRKNPASTRNYPLTTRSGSEASAAAWLGPEATEQPKEAEEVTFQTLRTLAALIREYYARHDTSDSQEECEDVPIPEALHEARGLVTNPY